MKKRALNLYAALSAALALSACGSSEPTEEASTESIAEEVTTSAAPPEVETPTEPAAAAVEDTLPLPAEATSIEDVWARIGCDAEEQPMGRPTEANSEDAPITRTAFCKPHNREWRDLAYFFESPSSTETIEWLESGTLEVGDGEVVFIDGAIAILATDEPTIVEFEGLFTRADIVPTQPSGRDVGARSIEEVWAELDCVLPAGPLSPGAGNQIRDAEPAHAPLTRTGSCRPYRDRGGEYVYFYEAPSPAEAEEWLSSGDLEYWDDQVVYIDGSIVIMADDTLSIYELDQVYTRSLNPNAAPGSASGSDESIPTNSSEISPLIPQDEFENTLVLWHDWQDLPLATQASECDRWNSDVGNFIIDYTRDYDLTFAAVYHFFNERCP